MDALVTAAKNGDKEAFVQLIRMNKQSYIKQPGFIFGTNRTLQMHCKIRSCPVMKDTGIKGSEIF